MSQYVASREEYRALQCLEDAGDGVCEVLQQYSQGTEIIESDSYEGYLTAVTAHTQPVDCAGCTDYATDTRSESWIWGALEAMGVGVLVAVAAVLAEEIDPRQIVGMLL
jgi:hypothetical protein